MKLSANSLKQKEWKASVVNINKIQFSDEIEIRNVELNLQHELKGHTHSYCNTFLAAIKKSNDDEHRCNAFKTDILGDAIIRWLTA